jgi:hypothetical protein
VRPSKRRRFMISKILEVTKDKIVFSKDISKGGRNGQYVLTIPSVTKGLIELHKEYKITIETMDLTTQERER